MPYLVMSFFIACFGGGKKKGGAYRGSWNPVDIYSDHGYNRRSVFGLFAGCGVAVRADI